MGFADIASRTAILHAIEESDSMGRSAFLAEYGFSEARPGVGRVQGRPHSAPGTFKRYSREASEQQAAPLAPEDGEDEAQEGRILYRRHRVRERNPGLVQRKKRSVQKQTGRLACEVCAFDFEVVYGQHGAGFIECHHTIPLAQATGSRTTRESDLAVVCSNCHRMLHRGDPSPRLADLHQMVGPGEP